MALITVPAHFDGERILLDEPIALERDTKLMVTILPRDEDEERDGWYALSARALNRAYGDDEPTYGPELVREANPDYAGG